MLLRSSSMGWRSSAATHMSKNTDHLLRIAPVAHTQKKKEKKKKERSTAELNLQHHRNAQLESTNAQTKRGPAATDLNLRSFEQNTTRLQEQFRSPQPMITMKPEGQQKSSNRNKPEEVELYSNTQQKQNRKKQIQKCCPPHSHDTKEIEEKTVPKGPDLVKKKPKKPKTEEKESGSGAAQIPISREAAGIRRQPRALQSIFSFLFLFSFSFLFFFFSFLYFFIFLFFFTFSSNFFLNWPLQGHLSLLIQLTFNRINLL